MPLTTKRIPNDVETFVIKAPNNYVVINSCKFCYVSGGLYYVRTPETQMCLGEISTAPNTAAHAIEIMRFITREEAENFKNIAHLDDTYRVAKVRPNNLYPTEFIDLPVRNGQEVILVPIPIQVYNRTSSKIKKEFADTYPHLKYSAFDNSNVLGSFSLNGFPSDISFKYVLNSATLYTVCINLHGGLSYYPLVINQGRGVNISQDPPELPFFGLTTYEDAQDFGNYFMQLLKDKKPLFFSQDGHPENNPTVEIRTSNMTEELNCTIIKLGVNLPELAPTNHSEGYHSVKLPAYYLFQAPNVLTNFEEVKSNLSWHERNFFWFRPPYVWQDEYLKRFFTYKTKFNFSEGEQTMSNKENLEEAKQIDTHDPRSYAVQFELGDYNNKGDLKLPAKKVVAGMHELQQTKNCNELEDKYDAKYRQDESALFADFEVLIDNYRQNYYTTDMLTCTILFNMYYLARRIHNVEIEPQIVANMSLDYLISKCVPDGKGKTKLEAVKSILEEKYKDICDSLISFCQKIAVDYKKVYAAKKKLRNSEFKGSSRYVYGLPYADNTVSEEPTEDELLDNAEQAMKDYQAEQERKRKEAEERRRKANLSRNLFDLSYDEEQPEDIFDDVTESLKNEYNSIDDDDDNISVKF